MEGLKGGIFFKVMTDEQMELLGKQIAAYATISKQLEELHRYLSNNDDYLLRGANPYSNSLITSSNQKLSRRQRWNPTSDQLRILERVFDKEGIKTPNPSKVKEINNELARYGQITELNVYNWFQNRRARLKKKQLLEEEANDDQSDAKVSEPTNLESDQNVSTVRNEEFCQENGLATTGGMVPLHNCFQGSPKMPINGRMSWKERHNHY